MRRTNTISISAGASYSAPAVHVLEVEAEGLLCASAAVEAPNWKEGQTGWFE